MKRLRARLAAVALFTAVVATSSHAILGIGAHYGLDFTLGMKDNSAAAVFDSLKLQIEPSWGTIPTALAGATTINGADIPIYVDRTDWARSPFDIGGKIYIDIIPFIDAVELSGNFGIWDYQGVIRYPSSVQFKPTQPSDQAAPLIERIDVVYDTMPLTLENFGLDFLGLKGTPYAKINADLTIRKYVLQFPKSLKTLRIYAGAGFTLAFSTPMVSAGLIEEALGDKLDSTYTVTTMGTQVFGNVDVMKEIGTEILARLMTPHYGCHIDVGTMVKIPIVPFGVYVDGKFVIPFGTMDPDVDIGGLGVLLNAGVVLHF